MQEVELKRFKFISEYDSRERIDLKPFQGRRPYWPTDPSIAERFASGEVREFYGESKAEIIDIFDAYLLIDEGNYGLIFDEKGNVCYEPSLFTTVCRNHSLYAGLEKFRSKPIPGRTFITFDAGWVSYYHWVCMAVAKAAALQDVYSDYDRIVFPEIPNNFPPKKNWIDIMSSARIRRSHHLPNGLYKCERLSLVWTTPTAPTEIMNYSEIYAALKKMALNSLNPSIPRFASRKLYFGRRPHYDARLGEAFSEKLNALLKANSVDTLYLEDLTIESQASIISSSDLVIAPHGAALTNMIFANDECKIVEINRETDGQFRPWYYQIASGLGYRYECVDAESPDCLEKLSAILRDH